MLSDKHKPRLERTLKRSSKEMKTRPNLKVRRSLKLKLARVTTNLLKIVQSSQIKMKQ